MRRNSNPFEGVSREIREAVQAQTTRRDHGLSGPASETSFAQVGFITPGGTLVRYGLLDVTLFDEFYLS